MSAPILRLLILGEPADRGETVRRLDRRMHGHPGWWIVLGPPGGWAEWYARYHGYAFEPATEQARADRVAVVGPCAEVPAGAWVLTG